MRTIAGSLTLAAGLLTGCKSRAKTKPDHETGSSAVAQPVTPATSNPGAARPGSTDSVDMWDEPTPPPSKPQTPPTLLDDDAIIATFEAECPAGATTSSARCDELRFQVENVLLQDLVGLRAAGHAVDREWYREAARAQTPQLACIAIRELLYAETRTPEEDALLLAGIDHPAPSVRELVFAKLPAVVELSKRAKLDRSSSGTCVDGRRDTKPALKWAGGYPGARFRYFASNESLRWFTTSDPVDKVVAYFDKSGRPARTEGELNKERSKRFVDEANRITEKEDPDDEAKMAALTQELSRPGTDWPAPFRNLSGVGEIRYVTIGSKQAIAIFKDDVLHATSIVASRPTE